MPVYESKEWTRMWYDEAPDADRPRVMLIGDSITAGYTVPVNRHLGGRIHADSIAGSKALDHPFYNEEIDFFARQFGFDYRLIHFNNGLHGWHLTEEEYGRLYEEKVVWLMERFPSAQIVLVTSTPVLVPGKERVIDPRDNPRVIGRNEAVWRIAEKYHLPVDDLYTAMLDQPQWRTEDGYHYNDAGTDAQGAIVAGYIEKCLNA